jgi:transposase InsO family protein
LLDVSRSGFYAWSLRPVSARATRDRQLTSRIRVLHAESRGSYGSPRIHRDLAAAGETVSRKRVARLMQESGLAGRRKRRFRQTTDSAHALPVVKNRLKRDFSPAAPNQAWAADITYIRCWEGWCYLAVVIDLFSRRVVGWAVAEHMRTELVLEALQRAITLRRPAAGLVHHSDRGSQYASAAYRAALAKHGIVQSMSRKGNCWDNAVVESFFATLKEECIYRRSWPTRSRVYAGIAEYIEQFYNCQRRHSTLDHVSPVEYELASRMVEKAA